jgi:peroxiredoxin
VQGNQMNGTYRKMRTDGSFLEGKFKAQLGDSERFKNLSASKINVSGKWSALFRGVSKPSTDTTLAVGIFEQQGTNVTGTFLTPTGDYRYLAGSVSGDSLLLSCFDGNHAFLFKAKIDTTTKTMNGQFFANLKLVENWTASFNPKAALPDAKTLTFLKPGFKTFDISFPNTKGQKVSLKDSRYQGKVTVVQIMGSWCPNCMDETKFLSKWYQANQQRGVEVLALGFEKSTDLAVSGPKLERLKKRFDVQYEVLLAGNNDKADASETLPMLNRIASFPTTIIIDKKGIVREVHTGFSGPGTGVYYDDFVTDFNRLIDKLLAE